ncbi:hypothetical protein, partial [Methylogaea oryzae]
MDQDTALRPLLLITLLFGLALPPMAGANGTTAESDLDAPQSLPLRETLERAPAAPFTAELRRLYEARAFQPLWSRGGAPTSQALALTDALLHAD